MEENLYWSHGHVALKGKHMELTKFENIDWADSDLERIQLEYDFAVLTIWNDTFQKRLLVHCSGFAGMNNLCIWDDTIIMNAELKPVTNEDNEFIRMLYTAYDRDFDYGGRSLKDDLLMLNIKLANNISFQLYCQKVEITESEDQTVL